jgi:hypothetical protein
MDIPKVGASLNNGTVVKSLVLPQEGTVSWFSALRLPRHANPERPCAK